MEADLGLYVWTSQTRTRASALFVAVSSGSTGKVLLICNEQWERFRISRLGCGRADRDPRDRRLVRGPSSLLDLSTPEHQ